LADDCESGVPGYEMNAWIGLFGPAGLQRPVIERLNGEVAKVQQMPDTAQALSGQGLEPWIGSPEDFAGAWFPIGKSTRS